MDKPVASPLSFWKEKLKDLPNWVDLGKHRVGKGHPTYFIAEIGNNHNGDYYLAKKSIEEAAKAGAHAVKFQKRFVKETFAKELLDKPLTKENIKGSTYGEYRENLELSFEDFIKLKRIADSLDVAFFATPFDKKSVDFLESVGVPFYKIASFDLTNIPLLDYVARKRKPIILSTGMASLEEIDRAVATILQHNAELIMLHCVSVYPSPDEHINLNAMTTLAERYAPLPVGYSGHEQDFLPTLTAISRGATIVERHFTLSNILPGPDHETVSITPDVFQKMTEAAKRIEKILGSTEKRVLEEEVGTRNKHAKSVVAKVAIPKGTIIANAMLVVKSPGYGIPPAELPQLIGQRAATDISQDSVIRKEDIQWQDKPASVTDSVEGVYQSKNA
jgi:N-acetylneuraminate synthase/N,N'-diacetyllegionaminate synthase